ncbi:UDP-glucose 4-epimerase GalE [Achromobacter kerstersii]|uniref:UDP-glucose 4-epimerase n=1 Tax=Achromobacter kerstersii TaxID=1353890 RepID=A0A6S7AD84_9BURK|nr:UDP-glucose 4-epimerase GalE [Achromobacter kerstersii]CAB3713560.1 UDP-glucose 4-epimerase [Achromobacter kerstersii]
MENTILVAGGAGYIGTHTLVSLIQAGYRPVVFDNFSNSGIVALERVEQITGVAVECVKGDIRDADALSAVFQQCADRGAPVICVLHLAALKAVGESNSKPLEYYDNNVAGTLVLLTAMRRAGVDTIVFSSSATVYGEPEFLPFVEGHRIAPTNPYGWTKAMVEQILQDLCASHSAIKAICLRYFNPIGSHETGLIGEDPRGEPNNLFPYITRTAIGRADRLRIFGDDYDTPDGTGVRDYVHVADLADGHVKAIEYALSSRSEQGFAAFNLGTGRGTSVKELIAAFEGVSGVAVPHQVTSRRAGDIGEAWADPSRANQVLGWVAKRTVDEMCRDGWKWQKNNPDGYPEKK